MSELYDESFYKGRVYPDYEKFKHIHKKRAKYLASLGVTGNVLELGSAYGYMVDELNLIDGISAVGIDISSYAVSKSTSNVSEMNIKSLDFESNDYDYIVSFNVLDNAESIEEVQDVAKILNKSTAQQIHIVITKDMFTASNFFHQVILEKPSFWTELYPDAKIICFGCWNIYEHKYKGVTQRGNWY